MTIKDIVITPRGAKKVATMRYPDRGLFIPLRDAEMGGVVKLLGEISKLEEGGGEASSETLSAATGLSVGRIVDIMADLGAAQFVESRTGSMTDKGTTYYRRYRTEWKEWTK